MDPDDDTVVEHDDTVVEPSGAEPPVTAPAAPPRRVGPYDVLRELGRGGMGVVYEAHDPRIGRRVAVKKLLAEVDAGRRDRFRREAQLLGQLRHPAIAQVFEVVLEGPDAPYLVMELVPGRPLVDLCRRGPLPGRRAAAILLGVCEAVAAAHEREILHRDLKPHNVMVGEGDRPVVLDFGMGKQLGPRGNSLTETGQLLGTPAYMPPEQVESARDLDARADVYALGATLYHALTGRPPFAGPSQLNVLSAVLNRDPVRPGRVAPGVHRDLETICLTCLEKDPARRYASAAALAADLRRYLEGEPIHARPVSRLARLARSVRRRKALAVGLALALALGGGAGLALVQRLRASDRALDKVQRASLLLDRLREVLRYRTLPLGTPEQERALIAGARAEVAGIVSQLEALTAEAPRPTQVIVAQGWAHLALMNLTRATHLAMDVAERDRSSGAANLLMGRVLTFRLAFEGLHGELSMAEANNARILARVSFERARKLGEPLDAIDSAWHALAAQDWGKVRSSLELVPAHRAAEEKELVLAFLEHFLGNPQAAARHVDAALALCPRMPEALCFRAMRASEAGRHEAAMEDLDRAAALAPDSARVFVLRAAVREAQGDPAGAAAECDAALRLDPRWCPEAYSLRAAARYRLGDLRGALRDLDTALELRPADAKDRAHRGLTRADLGDLTGALADLDEALRLRPAMGLAYLNRGVVKARQEGLEAGLADWTRAIELDPTLGDAYKNRAKVLATRGDLRRALPDFDQAILLLPGDGELFYCRGLARRELGHLADAADDFDRAVQLAPDKPRARLARAWGLESRGDLRGALAEYEAALRLRPDDAQAVRNRGVIREKLRDLRGAAEDYEQALRLDPALPDAAALRRIIERQLGRPSRY